jgi:hypothetical protein
MLTEPPLIPALVVGGEHSFVVDKLEAQLRRHGLTVSHHWEWKKKPKAFGGNADVVFLVTDMVSHALTDHVRDLAYEKGVPVIFGCRKWATNKDRLERAGFPERAPLAPAVGGVLDAPPEEPVLRVSVLPVPPASKEEPPVPQNVVSPSNSPRTGSALYKVYEQIVLESPLISNKEAYEEARARVAGTGISLGGRRPELLALIRKTHGIVLPNNKKIDTVPASEPLAATSQNTRIVTVPTSEVPPALLAATPKNLQPPVRAAVAPTDVRELVQLLRVAMEAEGIERLVVTKDAVTFRRVVIEEGSFDV